MAQAKLAEKLGDYFARLGEGRAHKIKPADVEKVIAKLQARHAALVASLAEKPEQDTRLAAKIHVIEDLMARAEWLLAQITRDADAPLRPEPLHAEKIDAEPSDQ
ncbi:MAG: hypothetical protein ACK4NW_04895 [Roseinatronobacter sp.]